MTKRPVGLPPKSALYDPANEHDSCGVGFICDIKGRASRSIVEDALHMNCCMEHRGGVGYEKNTGDGAGIMLGIPHAFLSRVASEELGAALGKPGSYGVGNVFLPQDPNERAHCKSLIEQQIIEAGQRLIGWREMPTDVDGADIGKAARAAMPAIEQLFIGAADGIDSDAFERKLYLIRKRSSHMLRSDHNLAERLHIFFCTLSSTVIVYKGMLTPEQVELFYVDLQAADFESHLAMVHSRFSTNTFPSWDRAQPNRFMSHNGEINTIVGNRNYMRARQGTVSSPIFGDDLSKLFPIVEEECSDSGSFDNVLEFLLMGGRTLQEAVLMMIPEAWQQHAHMDAAKRAFYEYNSTLMEPWDGPASIAFTDGKYIGAVLDRNGLRPSRYYITDDDKCIMASEVGVVKVDPASIIEKGRLQPGRIFLIDFEAGRMIPDADVKGEWASAKPYQQWLDEQRLDLAELPGPASVEGYDKETLLHRMQAFGYTIETMHVMLQPLVKELRDPLGSMGNDAALAVMSDKPRMLYDYFKQRFAQVTNPAIDSIREEVIMALECYIGPEKNLLDATPEHAHRLRVPHPILSNRELASIKQLDYRSWRSKTIDITFPVGSGKAGLEKSLARICQQATQAIDEGCALLVLSDRKIGTGRIAISSLIAVGTVHHHLCAEEKRTQVGLVVETGEAREVHHHCLLAGYGADAINPYLAFEALWYARRKGYLDDAAHITDDDSVVAAYRKGVAKGMLKVMAKMGISTLHSYKAAQIFEAVGLGSDVIERAFVGTASRVEGVGLDVLVEEMERRHQIGFPQDGRSNVLTLPNPGDFHWRRHGDGHMWDPKAIADLQNAVRTENEDTYWNYARHINDETTRHSALRGLLRFNTDATTSVPIEEVESEAEIVKRFATGAMSYGSISAEAHETLAIAMNRIGGKSNTGEGGEDPSRFIPLANGDSKRSAIKQVASGRFGVTINYLSNADELQIKIIQGAKPGEGGELPGHKVDDIIASIRHSTPGVGLISPPPHHDIYSIEDMAQLIHDLKNANPSARISVKLGAEVGVGTVAAGVTKARADHIVIAGDTGGTGASPLTSIKHAGVPWELGIAETHQTLVMNNLRSRVVLQTDGQIKTGRDVAIAALLGAEEFGFATAPLVALGCIMMRKCHLNTCPVGIATQDPELRKKFAGQPENVVNFFFMVAKELRTIMAELGLRTINEMVGRVDLLKIDAAIDHWKAKGLDLTAILTPAAEPEEFLGSYRVHDQDHQLERAVDNQLMKLAQSAIDTGKPIRAELPIINVNRAVGGMLSNKIIREVGPQMLPDDTITFKFNGSAGQSFGCWLAKGVTLEVEGDANDYVGKGLSGGKVIVYPPAESQFRPEENVLIGNVVLYGATSGEAYFRGVAAERFCVRNSGAHAVVEGVGDHACEYMTGGRVVVLGKTGRNFAAGMSGGIAYVWDPAHGFASLCNMETIDLDPVESAEDVSELQSLIERHVEHTGSTVGQGLLDRWPNALAEFVKVMPTDYKRVLAARDSHVSAG